ncbi:MAG: SGNH/GDSL hydrolase family protein [Fulvivirga sp.]
MKDILSSLLSSLLFLITMQTSFSQEKIYSYLALGDSYTIGESVSEAMKWPVQLVSRLNNAGYGFKIADPKIIATTGWTTQELKAAILEEKPAKDYDFVSLLIGVNNQYRKYPLDDYPSEFESLLKIAIEHAGGHKHKVIVVSIPDYGFTPFGKSKQPIISKGIDDYNLINQRITKDYGIKYYSITSISRNGLKDAGLIANDKLHPSGKQYSLWVDLILEDEALVRIFN